MKRTLEKEIDPHLRTMLELLFGSSGRNQAKGNVQSQVMYSLSRKQANECSLRSTGTDVNYSIDTMSVLFFY